MGEYVSVGCPVGQLNNGKMRYFFAGGQMLGLDPFAYRIWLCFFSGNRIENVVKNPDLLQEMEAGRLRAMIEEMIETGLMIPVDEVTDYIPLRQGIGVGYNEGQDCYFVYTDRAHRLDYIAYLIWSYSDGRKKISDILTHLRSLEVPITAEDEKQAVLSLLRESVLFLSLEA